MLPTSTPVYVIQAPSGRYIYVGRVPACLGFTRPATTADIMGGRAFEDERHPGTLVTMVFPAFLSPELAIDFAAGHGVTVQVK